MFHENEGNAGMSQKKSFALGLVAGVLVLCTICFFILLFIVLRGGISVGKAAGANQPAALPAAQPAADPQAGGQQGTEPVSGTVAPVTDKDHVRGDKNAPVTLIEYSDYQCPYCGRFDPVLQQVMKDYAGQVKWVYRHYPLSFHPNALPAANAAECASEQGKFWEFSDVMFANQDAENDAFYAKTAGDLGLNMTKFNSCYSAKKYNDVITADQASGNAAGVSGTPGTIVVAKDGSMQFIPGAYPYDSNAQVKGVKDIVAEALAK